MNLKVQHRLAGAVTIVALAIIFFPLIFDGSGYEQLPDVNLDIPAQPEVIIDQKFDTLPATGRDGLRRLREEIDLNTITQNPVPSDDSVEHWKAQVGVFADEENAKSQVQMLKDKGYAADYRSVVQADGTRFFVEIGPDDRQKIQQLAEELKSSLGFEEILIKNR